MWPFLQRFDWTALTFPDHYTRERDSVGGMPQNMRLAAVDTHSGWIRMRYRWRADLSDDEADRLDSRLRAFIACGIYDAARRRGLNCKPGPIHGRRPSWLIEDSRIPFSLADGGFATVEKYCELSVGPVMRLMGEQDSTKVSRQLARGFREAFKGISV